MKQEVIEKWDTGEPGRERVCSAPSWGRGDTDRLSAEKLKEQINSAYQQRLGPDLIFHHQSGTFLLQPFLSVKWDAWGGLGPLRNKIREGRGLGGKGE